MKKTIITIIALLGLTGMAYEVPITYGAEETADVPVFTQEQVKVIVFAKKQFASNKTLLRVLVGKLKSAGLKITGMDLEHEMIFGTIAHARVDKLKDIPGVRAVEEEQMAHEE